MNVKMIISDWEQIEEWVHQQKVWAVVPKWFAQDLRQYRLVELKEFQLFHDYYLYYRPELSRVDWFQALLKEIFKT